MYYKRHLEEHVTVLNRSFKILYIGGPRQVGKTTMLQHIAKLHHMNYVTLDDLTIRRLATNDPELFLATHASPLLIDEVQYAPELFPYLKMHVDTSEKKGQYWLTGSQQFSIMKNVKESLAGRVGILSLLGFSRAEIAREKRTREIFFFSDQLKINKKRPAPLSVFDLMHRGFFPALWKRDAPPWQTFYNSYLQTYVDRDLREMFSVSKISTFHTFLQLCAARTGQILNYSDLARDCGISVHSAIEWLGILENSMLIYLLHPYATNISKRLIKSQKIYFLDTGFAAYLTKWNTPETLEHGAMAGAFFETFVISEIIKSFLYRGEEPPITFFRDKEGHEVDVLIEKNNVLYPVEIKMKASISEQDFAGIEYFRKKYSRAKKGYVVCLSRKNTPFDRNNTIVSYEEIS